MLTEDKVVFHMDHAGLGRCIILLQRLQYLHFNSALLVKSFLVTNDFDCNQFVCLMIHGFYYLPKRPFSNHFKQLKPIRNMVMFNDSIVSSVIVIPVVTWVV
jgi:hypothetical protein